MDSLLSNATKTLGESMEGPGNTIQNQLELPGMHASIEVRRQNTRPRVGPTSVSDSFSRVGDSEGKIRPCNYRSSVGNFMHGDCIHSSPGIFQASSHSVSVAERKRGHVGLEPWQEQSGIGPIRAIHGCLRDRSQRVLASECSTDFGVSLQRSRVLHLSSTKVICPSNRDDRTDGLNPRGDGLILARIQTARIDDKKCDQRECRADREGDARPAPFFNRHTTSSFWEAS